MFFKTRGHYINLGCIVSIRFHQKEELLENVKPPWYEVSMSNGDRFVLSVDECDQLVEVMQRVMNAWDK